MALDNGLRLIPEDGLAKKSVDDLVALYHGARTYAATLNPGSELDELTTYDMTLRRLIKLKKNPKIDTSPPPTSYEKYIIPAQSVPDGIKELAAEGKAAVCLDPAALAEATEECCTIAEDLGELPQEAVDMLYSPDTWVGGKVPACLTGEDKGEPVVEKKTETPSWQRSGKKRRKKRK